jgi:preprotein translocase subunit SecF
MGIAVYSSIFFATPILVTLKEFEPRIQAHTKRVLTRRAAIERGEVTPKGATRRQRPADEPVDAETAALAGAAPKVGSRPSGKRSSGARGGRPGGSRPSGAKRR